MPNAFVINSLPYTPPVKKPEPSLKQAVIRYQFPRKPSPLPGNKKEKHETPTLIFCPSCANLMEPMRFGITGFHAYCEICGVTGPRGKTEQESIDKAIEIFKE